MQLHGLHHVTAVTGNVVNNLDFYTRVLGLRLVKKSVNQDDTSAYHLFYSDSKGTPGLDMTFFDWPRTGPDQRGTDAIVNTMFRVDGRAALDYWAGRLQANGVPAEDLDTVNGRDVLRFEDPEGQRLTLVDDGGAPTEIEVWPGAPGVEVPAEFAIRGFFAVALSVPRLERVEPILTRVLNFTESWRGPNPDNAAEELIVYGMDGGGPGKEVHLVVQPDAPRAWLGRGGVHHVAFRLRDDAEQAAWSTALLQAGVRHSGIIDRFWFKSLYFRISNGILFELATDGPGFAVDEDPAHLGEMLVLPPFLESRRESIEAGLRPI
ncbi:MAG: ring-cleaving dioxygenase [Candidatus Promineofilum sp.]|nr:ring-cleaving dioxygenase [Promineifilum sp.]